MTYNQIIAELRAANHFQATGEPLPIESPAFPLFKSRVLYTKKGSPWRVRLENGGQIASWYRNQQQQLARLDAAAPPALAIQYYTPQRTKGFWARLVEFFK